MSVLISNLNMIESIKLDIASAIEAKGVSMSGVSFPDYPSAIASISGGGGGYTEKDFTEGTIINISNSASYVYSYAFIHHQSLQTVSLPNCVDIGTDAFTYCIVLSSAYLPICTHIGTRAFSITNLENIYIPQCTSIDGNAFKGTKLTSIDLPSCKYIGASCFGGLSLVSVSIPVCQSLMDKAFMDCTSLQNIVLPMVSDIRIQTFNGCTMLSQITFGYSSVVPLSNVNTFQNTPIASGTGTIYVPASLVSDYQAANNWSTFASQIVSIPE